MKYCQWLSRLSEDAVLWGQEAIELNLASKAGVSILPGFVVSAMVFDDFFESPDVRGQIQEVCRELSIKEPYLFPGAAHSIRQIITKSNFRPEIKKQLDAYFNDLRERLLKKKRSEIRLVLQAAGLGHELRMNKELQSADQLAKTLKQLFSLVFEDKLLFERVREEKTIVPPAFAVVVQYCEKPEHSGVAFCHDPKTHDDLTIQIQACHHQRPDDRLAIEDVYRVDRKSLVLLSRLVRKQWWAEDGSGQHLSPAHLGKGLQTLTDEETVKLARVIRLAQSRFEDTKRFEWVYMRDQFFISRVRPYLGKSEEVPAEENLPMPLVIGLSGSLGWAHGPVRLIMTAEDKKKVKPGEIVVVEQLQSQDGSWISAAGGIICEAGSPVQWEGKLAKTFAVPAVLGAGTASHLRNGQVVTVDGVHGIVYPGIVRKMLPPQHQAVVPITGVKIYANVINPHTISGEQVQYADGIGLLRGEFILKTLGIHPEDIIRKKLVDEYVDILSEGLEQALRSVFPKPVHYQLHDVTTADLLGFRARHDDRHEPNPVLGYRGSHRLLNEPEVLDLEIMALTKLVKKGLNNVALMMPMARSSSEIKRMLAYLQTSALGQVHPINLWIKCETPATLIQMEELCDLGIAGVCFDVPSLAQLILGFDKENMQVAHYVDQTEEAVVQAITYAIATCRGLGIPTMLVAEMEELRPELVQAAIQAGLTAISINTEMLIPMHGLVASIERRMLLDAILDESEPVVVH